LLCYGVFYLYWRKVYLDELMGIPNRRALNERLSRLSGQYTIAMVDIDHFKRFNDTYGHEQGDTVLRFVASHLARNLHGEAYRYGGEEIAVVFEGKATPYGANEMESVRESLAKREFRIRSSNEARKRTSRRNRAPAAEWSGISVRVTVSVGVASFSREGQRPEEVLSAADLALYRAKQSGRNKVVAVQETAVETMRAA
jgi:diguanylate cyclase (GGDEF)-like protein